MVNATLHAGRVPSLVQVVEICLGYISRFAGKCATTKRDAVWTPCTQWPDKKKGKKEKGRAKRVR
jgi:hypothetical protein